jgi:hypothetical protein
MRGRRVTEKESDMPAANNALSGKRSLSRCRERSPHFRYSKNTESAGQGTAAATWH